jgi:hypothetical protein
MVTVYQKLILTKGLNYCGSVQGDINGKQHPPV